MIKLNNRVITLFMIFFLIFSSISTVNASDEYDLLKESVTGIVQSMPDAPSIYANKVIPLYDGNEKICGYTVSLQNIDGDEYGYFDINLDNECIIKDFSVSPNTGDLFESIVGENMTKKDKMYEDEQGNIYAKNSNIYVNQLGEKITSKEFNDYMNTSQTTKYSSYSEVIKALTGIAFASSAKIKQYDNKKSCITEGNIELKTKKYACSVVALTEIAYQDKVINSDNDIAATFNSIWKNTDTTVYKTQNNVSYGSTKDNKLKTGYAKYLNSKNKSASITVKDGAGFAFFKNAVSDDDSSLLSMSISGVDGGHTVNVVGYATLKSGNNTYNCLLIADGWTNSLKYINISTTSFTKKYGVRISM